ncbi:MAG: nuclear transport factor 2 family protein [Woeseiaceae bacterium]
MKSRTKILNAICVVAFFFLGSAYAQDNRDDGTDVWIAVEAQWDAEENGDKDWIDRLLADGFYGWGKGNPAPRSKSSTRMWDRFNDEQGEMVAHELYPLEIVVEGDTAIAHYLYSSAYENKDGDVETNHGRFTDVLIKTDDGWKFLGWHGGNDD